MATEVFTAVLKHYLELGLTLTSVDKIKSADDPKRINEHRHYLKAQSNILRNVSLQPTADLTGLGVALSNTNLICIDIDYCYSFQHVEDLLYILSLPPDYPWVIQTGSGQGLHIIVAVDSTSLSKLQVNKSSLFALSLPDILPLVYLLPDSWTSSFTDIIYALSLPKHVSKTECSPVWFNIEQYLRYFDRDILSFEVNSEFKEYFEKVQVMSIHHSLLPPSYHKSGGKYSFMRGKLPISYPEKIEVIDLFSFLRDTCSMKGRFQLINGYGLWKSTGDFKRLYGKHCSLVLNFKTFENPLNVDYYDLESFPEIIEVSWLILSNELIVFTESAINRDIDTYSHFTHNQLHDAQRVGRPLNVIAELLANDLDKVHKIAAFNIEKELHCLRHLFFKFSINQNVDKYQHAPISDAEVRHPNETDPADRVFSRETIHLGKDPVSIKTLSNVMLASRIFRYGT